MHNRGWSVSVTCGSRVHQICSASKMSNIIVPLRGTYKMEMHFPQAAPQRGLPAVKHGSAPSALFAGRRTTACRGAQNTNYLNLQPRRGCVYWGDCHYPHVDDCASLIVNMGLLRLQPLRGCASGCNNSHPVRMPEGGGDDDPGLRFTYPGL